MSERPVFPPDPEVPVSAAWVSGGWRFQARTREHHVYVGANPPAVGEVGRSGVHLGRYLAIHIDAWTEDEPPLPLAHSEWHDVDDLIAEFEGERRRLRRAW